MDALSLFLREAVAHRFEFGKKDCAMFCADWFQRCRGVDPAAEWRGHYRTQIGLARLLKRGGGIVALFDTALCAAGATRTSDPKRGDIAIVETAQGLTGGIIMGEMSIALVGDGIIVRNRGIAPLVAAWSV